MKKVITILMAVLTICCYSQNEPDWEITIGSTNVESWGVVVEVPNGGGFAMAGHENWEGGNALLVKTSPTGDHLWTQTYGGSSTDKVVSVINAEDGFMLLGSTNRFATGNNTWDIWMIKTDANGIELWSKTYGPGGGKNVLQTADGGYLISGTSLIKTDAYGNEEWRYDDLYSGYAIQTNDGGYALLYSILAEQRIVLDKRNTDGSLNWSTTYSCSASTTFASKLHKTSEGGFIICATTNQDTGFGLDAWIIKTDILGNIEWEHHYGGLYMDEAHDVQQTTDGGYIFIGVTWDDSPERNNDIWVVKIDAQGTVQWDYNYDYDFPNFTYSIEQTSDNGFVVGGSKYKDNNGDSDMWIVHFPPEDVQAWFTANPTSIEEGEVVNFTNGSLGTSTDWLWTFTGGDITSSDLENPFVTYASSGTYSATLAINSGTSTLSRTDYITVGTPVVVTYCSSNGDASTRWISSVNIENQINTSSSSGTIGYEDYTGINYTFDASNTYNIALTPGQSPGKKAPLWWRIWIDYNLDGDFTNDEVAFAADGKKSDVLGIINIPTGVVGETRMRVSVSKDGVPEPCGSGFIGEVEDYTVSFTPPIPQPPVADFTSDVNYVSIGTTVNFTDLTLNNPNTWLWSFDIGSGSDVTSASQNPSITYNIAGTYTVSITASSSIGSDTEIKVGYIVVTDSPEPALYCEPVNIQNGAFENIDEIVVGSNSNASGFGGVGNGYLYYFNLNTFVYEAGETVSVQLIPGSWGRTRYSWRIWIDLNGDGDFMDTDELLFLANNKKGEVNGSITIPTSGLTTDITRMRISMKDGSGQGACDDNYEGEVEDYNVQFISGAKSSPIGNSDEKDLKVELYPVPVSGNKLNIKVNNSDQNLTITIFNKNSSKLESFETNSNEFVIDVSDYSSGLYFIRISTPKKTIVKKIVKI